KACDATAANFAIDIMGEPRSPWNIATGCVFADHFVQKMEYDDTQGMRKAIEKAFTNRIKSLRFPPKKEALSQAEGASERSKHSQQQCKYQVSLSIWVTAQSLIYNVSCFN